MTNIEKLKIQIKDYITNPMDKYAFLVDGNWGCGKTYAVKKIINEIDESISNNNSKKYSYYISLNGVDNLEDNFKKMIINNTININEKIPSHYIEKIKKIIDGLTDKALNINISDLFDSISFLDKNKKYINAIVIDDIERCTVNIENIFGYFDKLLNIGIKIIIIMDSTHIKDNDKYKEIKEKIIGNTFELETDDSIFLEIINSITLNATTKIDLALFKEALNETKDKFFYIVEEDKSCNRKINLRLFNTMLNNTISILENLNMDEDIDKKHLYIEVIKNVYVHFHNKNYTKRNFKFKNIEEALTLKYKDSSQIFKIDLKFIEEYFKNGKVIENDNYKQEIKNLIKIPNELNLLFDVNLTEPILIEKANTVEENIEKYHITLFSKIIDLFINVDFILNTEYFLNNKDRLINKIKSSNIIFDIDDGNFMHCEHSADIKSTINKIVNEIDKNNRKLIYSKISTYLFNPYKINDIADVYEDINYTNKKILIDFSKLQKFICKKINNKKRLKNAIENKTYDIYFNVINTILLIRTKERGQYIEFLIKDLEIVCDEENDKYIKYRIQSEINELKQYIE